MATNLDWFQRTFLVISRDEDVINSLSDVKVALIGLNSSQLKYIATNLSLNTIFDCLNTSSQEQTILGCEVLKTLLSSQEPSVVLKQYAVAMIRALRHPSVAVKELILQEFNRAACDSDLTPLIEQWKDLMLTMVECIAHEHTAVSRGSIQFFIRLGSSSHGLAAIYSTPMLQAFDSVMKASDVVRYRVYEIAVEVSVNSIPGLEASHACGLLDILLNELKKDDILVKLTALEMVTKLALCYHGYEYLERKSVIKELAMAISAADNDPLSGLIMPGLIKFFGNVGQIRPNDLFSKYPQVVDSLFNALESDDISVTCIAMETIGYIAITPEGKRTLNKQRKYMVKTMLKVIEVIKKKPNEYRIRAMNTLTNLIKLEPNDQDVELLKITQDWFNSMGDPLDSMSHIMAICQQPFLELQLATLLLLQVLAEQLWGQKYIHNQPGLIEIILDRNSQATTMESKNLKYKVIHTLSESSTTESVFGEDIVKRLQEFAKEGPVFVPTLLEVAIERAT